MGNHRVNPPYDNQEYSGSGGEPRRPRDSHASNRSPQFPDRRNDARPYSDPTQRPRQQHESWARASSAEQRREPQQYPGWPGDEQASVPWNYGNGGVSWRPDNAWQQETSVDIRQADNRETHNGRRAYEGAAVRPRIADEAIQRQSNPRSLEHQRPDNRAQPGKMHSRSAEVFKISAPWVSAIVVSMLVGLVLVQVADLRALHGANPIPSVYAFFIGLIFIFSPTAVRILMRKTAPGERLILVILIGLTFYTIKIQASPSGFLLNDEFIHLRNTQNVMNTGHLFQYNPLLPTAAYYPGLATITATMADFTGLSIFVSGLIIIGAARIVISASLYLAAEKVTGSSRGAGVASLLYATNSMFLFWSAQFAYEDLALPMVIFTVWWIGRTRGIQGRVAAQVVTVIMIVAVTVTHHISTFALCGILTLLYLAERFFRYPRSERRYMGTFALLTGVLAAFWFFVVAKPAADYLFGQNFDPAMQGIVSALSGHGGRQLYGGTDTAAAAPTWYIDVGFAAILIVMGALLPAALRSWRILRSRDSANKVWHRAPIAIVTITALTFPFTLLPRLTANGSAISGRTSEFIFIAIGCTIGLLMDEGSRATPHGARSAGIHAPVGGTRTLGITFLLSVVFVGQVSIGNSFFNLLPDKSVGFPTYVQPYMISAADWSRGHLGIHQNFATDSTNVLSLATYGQENPANVNIIYPMFFSANMDATTVNLIKMNQVHYVLLDWNAMAEAPVQPGGSYYSSLEPDSSLNGKALPRAYYAKFSAYTCSHLVYQSGSVQIYDVSKIADGSCAPQLIREPSAKTPSGKKSDEPKAIS